MGAAGVDRRPDAQAADRREVLGRQPLLHGNEGRGRVIGSRECRTKCVSDGLKIVPPAPVRDSRKMSSCRLNAACIATESRSQRSVLPSMSVNANVTVPLGSPSACEPAIAFIPTPVRR